MPVVPPPPLDYVLDLMSAFTRPAPRVGLSMYLSAIERAQRSLRNEGARLRLRNEPRGAEVVLRFARDLDLLRDFVIRAYLDPPDAEDPDGSLDEVDSTCVGVWT